MEKNVYELQITMTGKSFSPRAEWVNFADEVKRGLPTMRAVYDYLKDRYGNAKRMPQYTDRKSGPPIKSGWVIGFRAADWSHEPVEKWLQQDWITIREVRDVAL